MPDKPKFLRYHCEVCAINESFGEAVTQTCDVGRRENCLPGAIQHRIPQSNDTFQCGFLNGAAEPQYLCARCNLCPMPYLTTVRCEMRHNVYPVCHSTLRVRW